MTNVDLKQTLKHLYAPSAKEVSQVVVPPLAYLMLDGEGDPNTSARYVEAVQTLYQLAYAVRAVSQAAGRVFRVMPLEGLWWADAWSGWRTSMGSIWRSTTPVPTRRRH